MMKHISIFLALSLVAGCATHSGRTSRTDLSRWKTVDLGYAGISLEMPSDEFSFQLHPQSNGFMVDSSWMITVSCRRYSIHEFKNQSKPSDSNPLSKDQDHMSWLTWMNTLHEQTSVRKIGIWQKQYRRDIQTNDDYIVSIHVTYYYSQFSESERNEDESAIMRILESVKSIDRNTQQNTAELRR